MGMGRSSSRSNAYVIATASTSWARDKKLITAPPHSPRANSGRYFGWVHGTLTRGGRLASVALTTLRGLSAAWSCRSRRAGWACGTPRAAAPSSPARAWSGPSSWACAPLAPRRGRSNPSRAQGARDHPEGAQPPNPPPRPTPAPAVIMNASREDLPGGKAATAGGGEVRRQAWSRRAPARRRGRSRAASQHATPPKHPARPHRRPRYGRTGPRTRPAHPSPRWA